MFQVHLGQARTRDVQSTLKMLRWIRSSIAEINL